MTASPKIGYSLSSEEHGGKDLVRFGAAGVEHGFTDIIVSDHYHPWNDAQGHSPFVWNVLGGLAAAAPDARLGTGVTCPTIRIHPAILAQAVATTAEMAGSFFFGIGSGENLNEHILGDQWPPTDQRLAMMEEAVELMRKLWTGKEITHRGDFYRVDNARIYTLPDEAPPVYVSAFGPKAAEVAARIGDGFVTTAPDADLVEAYRKAGGTGPAIGCAKACWAETEEAGRQLTHRLWPNMGLPGELAQEIKTPAIFEQAAELVDEETAVGKTPTGPEPEAHIESVKAYLDAGFDEVYVHQIGTQQEEFLRFYRDEVIPQLDL
ncbi:TIGR03557 family F420-dependent LLM class oxidoreductase [Aquihabitans daechungensis]|uniref:TIGR03557 family F420-dependent LLM class oxidoreductase n=1 Tax=Aquihabitans daechungensis TaxID=1052257 RepID=UPI003BA20EFC